MVKAQRKPRRGLAVVNLSPEDLEQISIKLETDYKEDWFNVFITDSEGNSVAQFGTSDDPITSEMPIKISAELAIKIHDMVDKFGREALLKDELVSERINELDMRGDL